MADFAARLAFFALAPIGIVFAASLFPVMGALINVVVLLAVFVAREAIATQERKWPWLRRVLERELSLDAYYRENPPRSFSYYVFYPFLFPYWLFHAEARREFVLFKGFTLASLVILAAQVVYQYYASWQPELGFRAYLPVLLVTLGIEMIFVLALLMPMATTIISLHQSFRRARLLVLVSVGLLSTTLAIARIARRRDPVVSYATRERVLLRTASDRHRAREAQLAALRASFGNWKQLSRAVEGDGKVEGEPLLAAHEVLEQFYKHDEAYAFDLWAAPRHHPELLVLYFEARRHRAPIWIALTRHGEEIRDPQQLPQGAFLAMFHAANE